MGLLNRTLWKAMDAFALRRTRPARETSADRFWWPGLVAGVPMTANEALRLSAVWACVTMVAKSIARCEWQVFEVEPNGDRDYRTDSITYRLLNRRPNPETTPIAFKEAALIQALVWGNFYAEIERDLVNRPIALWPLAPERCQLKRRDPSTGSGDNRLVLEVTNADRDPTIIDYNDVYHLHGPGVDGIAGFETVALAARSLAHLAAAERFGQAFYSNNATLGTYLTTELKLTQPQVDEVTALIDDKTKGPDKGFSTIVLPFGYKPNFAAFDGQKSQHVETRYLLIEETCRWYGVPPHKIALLQRSTNNNIEHQGIEFVRDGCAPWAVRMAQEADWKLLPQRGRMETEIDLEPLAEGDAQTRATTDSTLVNSGIVTRNEVRARRGWNRAPDKNADKLTVQSAMVPLEKIGEEKQVADPPAPAEPDDEDLAEQEGAEGDRRANPRAVLVAAGPPARPKPASPELQRGEPLRRGEGPMANSKRAAS